MYHEYRLRREVETIEVERSITVRRYSVFTGELSICIFLLTIPCRRIRRAALFLVRLSRLFLGLLRLEIIFRTSRRRNFLTELMSYVAIAC